MEIKKLSIVIPAYNEGKTIHNILNKIKAVVLLNAIQKEVIIVNSLGIFPLIILKPKFKF